MVNAHMWKILLGFAAVVGLTVWLTWSSDDERFVNAALALGVAEVQASLLARDEAREVATRDFAERMIKDYTQANRELTTIAAEEGIDVDNSTLTSKQLPPRLSNASGDSFDEVYALDQIKRHQLLIAYFYDYVENAESGPLKEMAEGRLAVLQQNLDLAEMLRDDSAQVGSAQVEEPDLSRSE